MVAVDEFTAPLAHETIGPRGGIGMHATADAVGRFIDAARQTGVLQRQSCSEAGNSGSDDSDPGHATSPSEVNERCRNIPKRIWRTITAPHTGPRAAAGWWCYPAPHAQA